MSVNVLTVPALRETFVAAAPYFESQSSLQVAIEYSGTDDIIKRMEAGENGIDLVVLDGGSLEELTKHGKIVSGSRVDFAKSRIGMAVRAGAPKPDVSTIEALKRALLASETVAYSRSLSGIHIAGLLEKWGLAEQLRSRIRQPAPGEFVGEMVARGDAEIGFQQMSELVHVRGVDVVGPIPEEIQLVTVVGGGVHARAKAPDGAKAWVAFLASPAAADILKSNGLSPN